ncbi:MAG: hypothetical protein ACRDHK_12065 [Actinomycetota bacterium]
MFRRIMGAALGALLLSGGLRTSPATADHTEEPKFDIIVAARPEGRKQRLVGVFPYLRHLTEYDPDAGWIDGDRIGYRCAYMFLVDDGEIVARVTFNTWRPPVGDRPYGLVNDEFMVEGARFYDGSLTPPGTEQVPEHECPHLRKAYKPLKGKARPRPVIKFSDAGDGHLLEVRDYRKVKSSPGHRFKIASARPDRVIVIGYQDRAPVVAVYYQRMSDAIRLTSNAGSS